MKKLIYIISLLLVLILPSCSCNNDRGKVIGYVTQFNTKGVFWITHEAQINLTQTGMTSTAEELDLSIDRRTNDAGLINILDSAAHYGWKVEIHYIQTFGSNFLGNRGGTSKFISSVTVLEKNPKAYLDESVREPVRGGDTIQVNSPIRVTAIPIEQLPKKEKIKHDTIYLIRESK